MTYVPGMGPAPADIMLVAEAPGVDEEKKGHPFAGASGWLLDISLKRVGLQREDLYITNVCHYRPPHNNINKFAPKSKKLGRKPNAQVIEGLVELYKDIVRVKPKVILPLGNVALWALYGKENISKRRGSVWYGELDMHRIQLVAPFMSLEELAQVVHAVTNTKIVPTYHPAYVLRSYKEKTIMELDFRRAKREAGRPGLPHPRRDIHLDPDPETAYALAQKLIEAGHFMFDIETPGGRFWCVSFCSDPSWGFSIRTNEPWKMELIRMLLESPVEKAAHNGLFDVCFLQHHENIDVQNYTYDTMYAHKLLYGEFRAGLDFQCSFYTNEPYYKDEGKDIDLSTMESEEQYMLYNGKDSCVQQECRQAQEASELKKPEHRLSVDNHMKLLPIAKQMMLRGLRIHMPTLFRLRKEAIVKGRQHQAKIDTAVLTHLTAAAKNHKDEATRLEAYQLAVRVMTEMKAERPGFNVQSNKDVLFYLYKVRGFNVKRHKTTKQPTGDEGALKELYGEHGDDTLLQFCHLRGERKLLSSYYTDRAVVNGRLRYAVNPVGTKTQRWTTGSTIVILVPSKKKGKKAKTGFSAQTMPPIMRQAVIADPGMVLFYADLAQVEDRIVAYAGGVKRKIYAFEHGINGHSMSAAGQFGVTVEAVEQEKTRCKREARTPPMYYIGKQSNHAYNYGEGPRTFKVNFNKKSDETGIRISESQSKTIRDKHFSMYPEIETGYWEWIKDQLLHGAKLTNPFGYSRTLYGKLVGRGCDATFRDGYSWYPQSTAPEIINRAMLRIWNQLPEVEMLLHAHDAILGQVPEGQIDEMKPAILELMKEPLYVRDHCIHIPVDIKFGERWSDCV